MANATKIIVILMTSKFYIWQRSDACHKDKKTGCGKKYTTRIYLHFSEI